MQEVSSVDIARRCFLSRRRLWSGIKHNHQHVGWLGPWPPPPLINPLPHNLRCASMTSTFPLLMARFMTTKVPELPDDLEDPAIEVSVDSDEDAGDARLGAQDAAPAVGDKRPRFDSARETLLWFNTAGPGKTKISNRGRDEWLKLMKDESYRLEEVLSQWNSHRDMEKTLMKAAV